MAEFILRHVFDGNNHCQSGVPDNAGCLEAYHKKCDKGHHDYITVEEYKKKTSTLSESEQAKCLHIIDRTLRVIVYRASRARPPYFPKSKEPYPFRKDQSTRHGTGFLLSKDLASFRDNFVAPEHCPCSECKGDKSNKKPSYYFLACTATHVVYNSEEVKEAVFELFYDSDEDRSKVKLLFGVTVFEDELRVKTDKCYLVCGTHDPNLNWELMKMCEELVEVKSVGFMVSHPHGVAKRISQGTIDTTEIHRVMGGVECNLLTGTEVTFPGRAPAISSSGGKMTQKSVSKCGNGKNNVYVLDHDQMFYVPLNTGLKYEELRFLWPDELKECLGGEVEKSTDMLGYSAMCYLSPGSRDRNGDWTDLALDGESEGFIDEVHDDGALYANYFYQIATCPGSSGALILAGDKPFVHAKILHYGYHPTKGNRSGLCSPLPVY